MDNLLVRLVDVDDDSEILQIQFDEAERARILGLGVSSSMK